jgi:hypothetical protein
VRGHIGPAELIESETMIHRHGARKTGH